MTDPAPPAAEQPKLEKRKRHAPTPGGGEGTGTPARAPRSDAGRPR